MPTENFTINFVSAKLNLILRSNRRNPSPLPWSFDKKDHLNIHIIKL